MGKRLTRYRIIIKGVGDDIHRLWVQEDVNPWWLWARWENRTSTQISALGDSEEYAVRSARVWINDQLLVEARERAAPRVVFDTAKKQGEPDV